MVLYAEVETCICTLQPGIHVNDENGESYVRMGPGVESSSIAESSGSDLHVIKEEPTGENHKKDKQFLECSFAIQHLNKEITLLVPVCWPAQICSRVALCSLNRSFKYGEEWCCTYWKGTELAQILMDNGYEADCS